MLFIALIGWNVGLNSRRLAARLDGNGPGDAGHTNTSTTLTFLATRWGHRNRELRAVRAFKQGMAPVVIALLVGHRMGARAAHDVRPAIGGLWLLTAVSAVVVWRTRLHLLWLLGTGAVLRAFGLV